MDEDEYHSQSEFYYPEELETSEAGISESQEAIDDFINKHGKVKTQKKKTTTIQLHFKKLCDGFYTYTSVSGPEMRAMRTIDLMLLLKVWIDFHSNLFSDPYFVIR